MIFSRPPVMREIAEALARGRPAGRAAILAGATHDIVPAVVGPALAAFLEENSGR
jgi:hypothetical protein